MVNLRQARRIRHDGSPETAATGKRLVVLLLYTRSGDLKSRDQIFEA
jgi:hypothetical protein